jgi:guanylate kinase
VALTGWQKPDRGVIFVITGPSGVGKSTLINHCRAEISDLRFSVSATTRAPRSGEQDGVDYHFLNGDDFATRVASGAFLEHATVYGRSYGTLAEPTEAILRQGESIILDIDIQGANQVRATGTDATHVFILPPDLATLEHRLRARGTDSDEIIAGRMAQVKQQLDGADRFDFLVMNDDVETAKTCLLAILLAAMSRRECRDSWIDDIQQATRRDGLQPSGG